MGIAHRAPTKACLGETEASKMLSVESHQLPAPKLFFSQACTLERFPPSQVGIFDCNPISVLSAEHLEGAKPPAAWFCT